MNGYKRCKRPSQFIKYLLFMLSLFPLAFAQPVSPSDAHSLVGSSTALTPKDAAGAPADEAFARASVSVVRVVVSYTSDPDANGKVKTVACTGLGVLVNSSPKSTGPAATDLPNDWVLTDGSLVNTHPVCSNNTAVKMSQIQIFFNTTYNSKSQVSVQIDTHSSPPVASAVTCSADPQNCSNGPALIAFQGDEAPFVALAPSSSRLDHTAIALTNASGAAPVERDTPAHDAAFLTPQPLALNSSSQLEFGTPFIDATGKLIHLASPSSSIPLDAISTLIKSVPTSDNPVNTNWNKGIDDYYQKNYANAQTDFNNAASANANFLGAKDFAIFAQNALNAPQQPVTGFSPFGIHIGLWESSVVALVIFALLLLFTSLLIRPRLDRRRAFHADLVAAERQASSLAQEIEQMKARQHAWAEHPQNSEQSTVSVQQQALQDKAVVHKLARDLPCPRCGKHVAYDAKYCPNCRQVLTHSATGQYSRIRPSAAPVPKTPTPRIEFDATEIRADINSWQITERKGV